MIDAISVNNLQSLMRSFYTALVLLYQSVANKNGISDKFLTFVYNLVSVNTIKTRYQIGTN